MTSAIERRNREKVNNALAAMDIYHDGLPINAIDNILLANGFDQMEAGIYCGREGRVNEKVGDRTWLCMSWYKMEVTGRYEVTAYVS